MKHCLSQQSTESLVTIFKWIPYKTTLLKLSFYLVFKLSISPVCPKLYVSSVFEILSVLTINRISHHDLQTSNHFSETISAQQNRNLEPARAKHSHLISPESTIERNRRLSRRSRRRKGCNGGQLTVCVGRRHGPWVNANKWLRKFPNLDSPRIWNESEGGEGWRSVETKRWQQGGRDEAKEAGRRRTAAGWESRNGELGLHLIN